MSYDSAVLRRATERLEQRRRRRDWELEQRRTQVAQKVPQVLEIDGQLRQTLLKIAQATFRGGDPTGEIEALRDENLALQARRAALLQQAGLPEDFLEEKPVCPQCGDRGWNGSQMCQCLRQLCTQEQIAELSKLLDLGEQRFDTFRLDYYSDRPMEGGGPSPREHMSVVLQVCRQYAQQFGHFSWDNLYLYGGPGLGKTFLSACIARTVSEGGFSVVYDTAGSIFAAFESQKFSKDQEDLKDARDETRRYLRCELLIVDDLGTELNSPFVQTALYTLLNTRLTTGRRTVISSNLDPDQMRARYSPQIASRINGAFRTLPFLGQDIRQRR